MWKRVAITAGVTLLGGVAGVAVGVVPFMALAMVLVYLQVGLNLAVALSFLPIATGPAGLICGLLCGAVWSRRYVQSQ